MSAMALRRLVYALVLAGALLFQITNDNYLAHFLLAVCAALPPLSLAISLRGMLGCRMTLCAVPAAPARGGDGRWQVSVDIPGLLPLARLALRTEEKNLLTGHIQRRRLSMSGVAGKRPADLSAPTGHCGVLELRADKIRVYDYLGLFSRHVPSPPPARMQCSPIPADTPPPLLPEGLGLPAPYGAVRRGPGEDYDLRDYRPGDPMRAVHWKLSSKWDKLIVRERADAALPLPLLTLDRLGSPGELDRLLDKLLGLSRALLSIQRPHAVLWLERDGRPQLRPVSDEKELQDCLAALLGSPAPRTGPKLGSLPELPQLSGGASFRIHVALEGGEDGG